MEKRTLNPEQIKNKIVRGVVVLTVRTFLIQTISFLGVFILTIILEPSVFGIFFLVTAILNVLVYFSDVGLAAALIQKREKITLNDLSTTFFIQQGIVITLVIIGMFASGFVAKYYNLDNSGLFLLRALVASLLLSSLKTIPSIILEREMNFEKLIIPQIAETVVFYFLAILLASSGFGIHSFAWAALARGLVGLIIIFLLKPWLPRLIFDKSAAKKLVTFGVPFQANSILALLKDDLITVFVGKLLNYTQVGYIGWGQKFAFMPLRFMMDSVIKVTFPAYSRLQDDKENLKKAIEKSIYSVTALVFPLVVGICAIATDLVEIIPRYQKWQEALPVLYLFSVNALFASINTPLVNILFALGKPKIVLRLMIFWTFLTWILTFSLFKILGFLGVPLASAIVAGSTSIVIYFVKKEIQFSILSNIKTPIIASIVMLLAVLILKSYLPTNYLSILILIVTGATLYIVTAIILDKTKMLEIYKLFLNTTKSKKL